MKILFTFFLDNFFPTDTAFFMDANRKATKDKYSYILVDISPHSNEDYSLRSQILPGQVLSVFVLKTK